jgi:tRNA threonylcarbamoyl adenosine modification protein YeaZ
LPAIDALLKTADKSVRDLTHVIVIKGPGLFTGLRVGVTIANTIAYSLQIPIAGVNTMQYLRAVSDEQVDMTLLEAANGVLFVKRKDYMTDDGIERVAVKDVPEGLATGFVSAETTKHLPQVHWVSPDKLKTPGETFSVLPDDLKWQEGSVVPLYCREPGITKSKKL